MNEEIKEYQDNHPMRGHVNDLIQKINKSIHEMVLTDPNHTDFESRYLRSGDFTSKGYKFKIRYYFSGSGFQDMEIEYNIKVSKK